MVANVSRFAGQYKDPARIFPAPPVLMPAAATSDVCARDAAAAPHREAAPSS